MRLRVTPRTVSFVDAFGGLAGQVHHGALAVRDSLGATSQNRHAELDRLTGLVGEAERGRAVIVELARTSFVTPFDRGDIHALAVGLADCVTHMERAVDASISYRIEEFPEGSDALVDALVRMGELTAQALTGLRSPQALGDYPLEVRRLGGRAEQARRRIMTQVLAGRTDPLGAVRSGAVVEELAGAARSLERVATVVEGIVVKES